MTVNDCIRILDETTANKIAAGEVVERPASAVKELVENSIDAGSTRIDVEIEDGGLRFIRVTDNGHGMSKNDARLSLARHATSKIQTAEDLSNISTLGFRGEAIPSIASVSRFTVITRRAEDLEGIKVHVEGGNMQEESSVGCPVGTSVTVRDLFFNTPARLKYLKTTATEAGHIIDVLNRLALAYPHIAFRLQHNGRQLFTTTGSGDGRATIASIYGPEVSKHLLLLKGSRNEYHISGFITKPNVYRKNRNHENIFVNGRFIRSRLISRALEDAFKSLLPVGAYPMGTIAVDLPSTEVDVNVHPTKSEVKFQKERDVFLLVYHTVKASLQDACLIPEAPVQGKTVQFEQGYHNQPLALPEETDESPKHHTNQCEETHRRPATFYIRESDFAQLPSGQGEYGIAESDTAPTETTSLTFPLMQPIGQIENTFIVAQGIDGMYLIDQHAAHERILYEKLAQRQQTGTQQLLVPWVWETTMQEALIIQENIALFYELGFEIEDFGAKSFRVCSMPLGIPTTLLDEILLDFLQALMQTGRQQTAVKKQELLLITTACKAAIKAHAKLSLQEMTALIHQLSGVPNPFTCPHGRPTIIHFSNHDLACRFKRIQ